MARQKNTLDNAHKSKNDEFYTQYEDVEREMNNYFDYNMDIFNGKVVLCPCDDDDSSNFTRYFAQNFSKLGLKKLICTSYAHNSKEVDYDYIPTKIEMSSDKYDKEKSLKHGKVYIIDCDEDGSGTINFDDIKWDYLEGDGDLGQMK